MSDKSNAAERRVLLELLDGRKGSALVNGTPNVLICASRAFVRQDDSLLYIEHVTKTVRIIDIEVSDA